ncbi:TRAP transporter small permease [Algihabitans albus]|uniref:TRAP transporter small permease n=1 Tax=Algihabitans albus TaxID=2164067 RepID=UPI000E5D7B48|nr:TRAP transporter small permease subunit [Algihabitans albus]
MTNEAEGLDETTSRVAAIRKGEGPGGPFPALVEWLDRGIVWTACAVSIAVLTSLFLALFVNVVLRYLLGEGITWAYELPQLLFPWLAVAGAVLAAQKGAHIAVQVMVDLFPLRGQRIVLVAVELLVLLLFAGIARYAVTMAEAAASSYLAVTGLSEAWGFSSIVAGGVALALTAATSIYRLLFLELPRARAPSGQDGRAP